MAIYTAKGAASAADWNRLVFNPKFTFIDVVYSDIIKKVIVVFVSQIVVIVLR